MQLCFKRVSICRYLNPRSTYSRLCGLITGSGCLGDGSNSLLLRLWESKFALFFPSGTFYCLLQKKLTAKACTVFTLNTEAPASTTQQEVHQSLWLSSHTAAIFSHSLF